MKAIVEFQPEGRRVEVERGLTILEAARLGGVKIRSVCGGVGSCGKCTVTVEEGEVTERSGLHRKFISEEEASKGYHLACQTEILSDIRVAIPPETRIEGQQILAEALLSRVELDPCCIKRFLKVRPGELGDRVGRSTRLSTLMKDKIGGEFSLFEGALSKLQELPEDVEGITLVLDRHKTGYEISDIDLGDTSLQSYGLALDIGTTKVAGYLVDLRSGEIKDMESGYNEQLIYGEDLLSRIDYAFRSRGGLSRLQNAVVATINKIAGSLSAKNHVSPGEIVGVSVGGNTVMTYLLAGMDPSPLVDANAQVSRDPIRRRAKEFGVAANPNASVYCLPSVSRFLGGDAVADVLASGMHEVPHISILIDMGTNGEIIIGSQGWLLSTSCAAGPAFEGWEIRFGMRSVEGAIEHVEVNTTTFEATYTVIGGAQVRPRGICGSGIIDALAEMYRSGLVDSFGKMRDEGKTPLIRKGVDGFEYVLSSASDNELGKDIVITQRDLDNLMDSKAAVCGSVAVLMKKVGATIADIRNIYLAGAFGNYVDSTSATTIGIFPEFPNAKFTQIGNGSVAGAYLALISLKKREEAEQIAETMTYYDLTVDPDFMEEYSAAFSIPGRAELFPSSRR